MKTITTAETLGELIEGYVFKAKAYAGALSDPADKFKLGGVITGLKKEYLFEHFCLGVKRSLDEVGITDDIGFHTANHLARIYLAEYERVKKPSKAPTRTRKTFSTAKLVARFAKIGATAEEKTDAKAFAMRLTATQAFERTTLEIKELLKGMDYKNKDQA